LSAPETLQLERQGCFCQDWTRVRVQDGFDAAAVRVTGNVVGKAPFTGSLSPRGWKVSETRLPKLAPGHDASIVAQAEVEL